jgi:excisionase family DNA binding protein
MRWLSFGYDNHHSPFYGGVPEVTVLIKQTFIIDGVPVVSLPSITDAPEPEPAKPVGALLSVSETALILGVTEDTIRKWARAGKITSVRLSKVDVRFRQADIDEFIGSRLNRRKSAFR